MPDAATTPIRECDLVMKGGVTSGVVYPRAILELSKTYRFRSIGGASAGGIAAAFAAAGEYARQGGDPNAFKRFEERCDQIPDILGGLFQAEPPFRGIMNAALALTGPKEKRLTGVLKAFAGPLLLGASLGLLIFAPFVFFQTVLGGPWLVFGAIMPGALLAATAGALVMFGQRLWRIFFDDLPRSNFGFCTGLKPPGSTTSVLTEWLHESLQYIAFGAAGRTKPLTFEDLWTVGQTQIDTAAGHRNIDLRMMTSNLSMQRPHALPDLIPELMFVPAEWSRLFPSVVMTWLDTDDICGSAPDGRRYAPRGGSLPVVVAVRMSLSFPILFEAVPMHLADRGAMGRGEVPTGQPVPIRKLLFSDGGITSNFPIHFFDALLPVRPTFALSLDDVLPGAPDQPRVSMPQGADAGALLPIRMIKETASFLGAVLNTAKDWQDDLLSVMPGERQRVIRIRLTPDEGGLNLNMPPEKSRKLMEYGRQAGDEICTTFDFDEHRWRRTLVAYEAFERLVTAVRGAWPGYSVWYAGYWSQSKSYGRISEDAREMIGDRFDRFSREPTPFDPSIDHVNFPRPTGRLRIVPDV